LTVRLQSASKEQPKHFCKIKIQNRQLFGSIMLNYASYQ
jgi:hypothetical protein